MMIMIMIIINNNKNNILTFGSPRFTWILEAGLMLVTGSWLPVEEVLIYSHKEKSPAPWGPCGPIGPWEPLNPWGPIAPWDPLNPWGPAGPIGPWEPFTLGGPTGPGSLLTFSTWKENKPAQGLVPEMPINANPGFTFCCTFCIYLPMPALLRVTFCVIISFSRSKGTTEFFKLKSHNGSW